MTLTTSHLSTIGWVKILHLERVSDEDTCLQLVCGGNRGMREVHSLFMQLLPLDISASDVVSEQILRDRAGCGRCNSYASQQGGSFLPSVRAVLSLLDSMAGCSQLLEPVCIYLSRTWT